MLRIAVIGIFKKKTKKKGEKEKIMLDRIKDKGKMKIKKKEHFSYVLYYTRLCNGDYEDYEDIIIFIDYI